MRVITYALPFRPPFFSSLENLHNFDPYMTKIRKMYFDTYFLSKSGKTIHPHPPPPLWAFIAFRGNRWCWAPLSETQPVIKFVCDKSLNDGFDSSCSIGFPDPTNILYVVANWFTFLGSMVLPKYGTEISLFIRWCDNIWINNDILDLWCNILFQLLFWWLPTIWLSLLHFK